jgi:hypothetical protein
MNLQTRYDLETAKLALAGDLGGIERIGEGVG